MWAPAIFVITPTAAAAAGEVVGGFDPWQLIGYGLTPVTFVVLFLTGQIVSKGELARALANLAIARQELADERTEAAKVQDSIIERVIPAVTKQTLVLEAIAPLLQTETHLRRPPRDG